MNDSNENPNSTLTLAQKNALRYVHVRSLKNQHSTRNQLMSIFRKEGLSIINIDTLIKNIQLNARVTLNFHPDRMLSGGQTVIEGLYNEGKYHSQFVTQITNGSRTAYSGGDRDKWELILFDGAYHEKSVSNYERPKYGALNLMWYSDGASPRFGSCFIQLYPHVLRRCTFTFGDSYTQPKCVSTINVFESIFVELFNSVINSQTVLGYKCASVTELVQRFIDTHSGNWDLMSGNLGRALDDYIEAQIHGEIDLATDVEALIADPSFKSTIIEEHLEKLCEKYSIRLLWHSGFRMKVDDVPNNFRGPTMAPFAQRVNQFAKSSGILDAAAIGKAAAMFYYHPEYWKDWGTSEETFQHLKQLWHVLVRFG